jgi:hypothetical protein
MLRRYGIPIVLVVGLIVWRLASTASATAILPTPPALVYFGLWLVALGWWIFAAAFDPRRLVWRLAMIWTPAIALALGLVGAAALNADDIAVGFGVLPVIILCMVCLLASGLTAIGDGRKKS